MRQSLKEAAAYMVDYANQSHRAVDVTVGLFAWLSTAHLCFSAKLSQKLVARWAGPFRVVSKVGDLSFWFESLAGWCLHPVFHAS